MYDQAVRHSRTKVEEKLWKKSDFVPEVAGTDGTSGGLFFPDLSGTLSLAWKEP